MERPKLNLNYKFPKKWVEAEKKFVIEKLSEKCNGSQIFRMAEIKKLSNLSITSINSFIKENEGILMRDLGMLAGKERNSLKAKGNTQQDRDAESRRKAAARFLARDKK